MTYIVSLRDVKDGERQAQSVALINNNKALLLFRVQEKVWKTNFLQN